MMKGELLPHVVPDVAAVLPLRGGMPITGKFEDLVQRCAQLEGENAVLAYKLRRMRRTIRRLGQDNAFIQRRLREHIKRKEGSATTFAALAVGKPIEQPCRPPGELEHMNHPKEVNVMLSTNEKSEQSKLHVEELSQLEWVQLTKELKPEKSGQTTERAKSKFRENPFIPLGLFATTCCLGYGLYTMYTGQRYKSQIMMRWRVACQGLTVVAMVVGMAITTSKKR
ncbi:HIG1 domain family member 2A [Tropilaelaps mercedesae]|uniref:HIG1 domain family member 2A n=1 Tax=Tropilaelaps mercedesae TaxID=418985 RepID=A0A1V9XEY9_9ACAR|nr:HIG1 domain family member 2A [Tropilaelaps mercedesae]